MTSWLFGCIDVTSKIAPSLSSSELAKALTLIAAITTTIAIQDFRDLDGEMVNPYLH
jgi:hypothetical protein